MHIRQIALVARDLEASVDRICDALGVEVGFRDPGVKEFGLANAVMPVGTTFLEVVSPIQENTTAGRYLERRRGDGGYMVILQTKDLDADRRRLGERGVRIVWEAALDDIACVHLHPRDVGGAIVSFDDPRPPDTWRWAGPDWMKHLRTEKVTRIVAAELQSDDPARLAKRWARALDQPAREVQEAREVDGEAWEIPLEGSAIRFVRDRDGRGEGLAGIDLARAPGETGAPAALELCGTRFRLV